MKALAPWGAAVLLVACGGAPPPAATTAARADDAETDARLEAQTAELGELAPRGDGAPIETQASAEPVELDALPSGLTPEEPLRLCGAGGPSDIAPMLRASWVCPAGDRPLQALSDEQILAHRVASMNIEDGTPAFFVFQLPCFGGPTPVYVSLDCSEQRTARR